MSWFFSRNDVVATQPNAQTLTDIPDGGTQETRGGLRVASTLRIIHPWRGGVPHGVCNVTLKVVNGDAYFGTGEGAAAKACRELTVEQVGDPRASRVFYLTFAGTQFFNTTHNGGAFSSTPTRKEFKDVTFAVFVDGNQFGDNFTLNPLSNADDGVRPGRIFRLTLGLSTADKTVKASLEKVVDPTCQDLTGDCVDATTGCMGTLFRGTYQALRHPLDTGSTALSAATLGIRRGIGRAFNLRLPSEEGESTHAATDTPPNPDKKKD